MIHKFQWYFDDVMRCEWFMQQDDDVWRFPASSLRADLPAAAAAAAVVLQAEVHQLCFD